MTSPRSSHRWPHRLGWLAAGLVSMVTLAACSSAESAPQVATVERVSMATGVSSTGSLSAASEQNLGFAKGGQLTAVNVKVGDHVEAGQVLASIDPVPARQALDAERAQLRAAEAQLDKAKDSPGVDDAEDSLSQAKDVLDAVERQVSEQDQADQVAIVNAQRQLAADQAAVNSAPDAQTRAAAEQRVIADQAALSTALQKRELDRSSGQVSIENAQLAVTTARNTLDTSESDRPHTIDQQRALVAAAEAENHMSKSRGTMSIAIVLAFSAGTVGTALATAGLAVSDLAGREVEWGGTSLGLFGFVLLNVLMAAAFGIP